MSIPIEAIESIRQRCEALVARNAELKRTFDERKAQTKATRDECKKSSERLHDIIMRLKTERAADDDAYIKTIQTPSRKEGLDPV